MGKPDVPSFNFNEIYNQTKKPQTVMSDDDKSRANKEGLFGVGGVSLTPTNETETGAVEKNGGNLFDFYESYKHLYQTGLQDIFNDYQRDIASLSKEKQKAVQDAYHIREMSKKYLGEYASNTGIGDVSGNLIDIYSKYQQNLADIESNYSGLEIGLTKTYEQNKLAQFEKILQNQYDMTIDQMEANAQKIAFNIATENTDGLSAWEYLQKSFTEGVISETDYMQIYNTIYNQGLEEISTVITNGLSTGSFGMNENGEEIKDPIAYLDSVKEKYRLTDSDYAFWKMQIETINATSNVNFVEAVNYRNANAGNMFQPYYDPQYYTDSKENVGTDSWVMRIKGENGEFLPGEYVQVLDNVEQEANQEGFTRRSIDFEQLDEAYNEKFGLENLQNEDMIQYLGDYYVYRDGQWFRTINIQGGESFAQTASENQNGWSIEKGQTNADGSFNKNSGKMDTLIVNGITYVETKSDDFSKMSQEEQDQLNVTFNQIHGDTKPCVVFFQGRLWEKNTNGRIAPMAKKTD